MEGKGSEGERERAHTQIEAEHDKHKLRAPVSRITSTPAAQSAILPPALKINKRPSWLPLPPSFPSKALLAASVVQVALYAHASLELGASHKLPDAGGGQRA